MILVLLFFWYKWIKCHNMIFNVRMDFTHKAHFIEEHHMMYPNTLTYSNIVSCDKIHITLLLVALNLLNVVIVRALCVYSVGEPLWEPIWSILSILNSSLVYPDVWFWAATKPNGFSFMNMYLFMWMIFYLFLIVLREFHSTLLTFTVSKML